MFDLFRSRAMATRVMLGAMLGILALSMLVYLIPGAGSSLSGNDDQVVAEIGKEPVTVQEVDGQIRNQLQNAKIPPEMADIYIPQLIDQSLAGRAMAYEAKRLGLEVSDSDVAYIIHSFPFGGLPADQYQQYVVQQFNMPVQEFENNLRLNAYGEALQSLALEGSVVSAADVETAFKQQNEKIKFQYIALIPEKLAEALKPSEAELKTYFEANKNFFPMPETRDVQVMIADQDKIGASIPVSDTDVQTYYNAHQEQYRTPERVHARHILIATANKSDADKAKLKAKAEDLLKQAKGGADFAKLAEKNSEDPGSAAKGGDLGWVVRGQMVKEFEDATFALKPAEISNVITTQYGFHIIQVLEKEPAHLKTLAEVKPEILSTLRSQTVFDKMQALVEQARSEWVKSPQNGQQIAGKLGLQFVDLKNYRPGNAIAEVGNDQQTGSTIAGLKKGEISQVVQAGTKFTIAEVTNINPPHAAQFAEVQQQVRMTYLQNKATTVTAEKQNKILEMLKANGGDLVAAGKAAGVEAKVADFFSRDGAAEGVGPARALTEAFDKPDGTIIGPVSAAGQAVIGKVIARQAPDMSKLPEQRQAIVLQLKQRNAQIVAPLLQDSVMTRLIQEGKIKKHQDVINKMIARYRNT